MLCLEPGKALPQDATLYFWFHLAQFGPVLGCDQEVIYGDAQLFPTRVGYCGMISVDLVDSRHI